MMEWFKGGRFMIYWCLIFHFSSFPLTAVAESEEILPKTMQDEIFQFIFRDTNVLLSFLNAVFKEHQAMGVGELTMIDLHSREPKRRVDRSQAIFDVSVTDNFGENYIIEMQRDFESFHVDKFQYYATQAYCDFFEVKYKKLVEEHKRPPSNRELYRNAPRIILIVITKNLSAKPFVVPSLARTSSNYSIYASTEKFGHESKLNYLFIDLEEFQERAPKSSYEKWIHFFKYEYYTKDATISNDLELIYADEKDILKALRILREVLPSYKEKYNEEWEKRMEDQDAGYHQGMREIAERLLEQNETNALIQKITHLSDEEIDELRNELHQ
ncbi:uncharacterized protein LOC135843556 [Planococcus citri]|uniref:uncharacterized protein LOC135843556 n=1 Tax=Planococcus citri TaxID=170843 RepID=UPI0031FA134A